MIAFPLRYGVGMEHPKKNGVEEVVDDPPWSCDPAQSIGSLCQKKGKKSGVVKSRRKKCSVPCALCLWLFDVDIFPLILPCIDSFF